jgi:hypothetical protein
VRTAQLAGSFLPVAPLPVDLYNKDMAAARLAWVTGRDNANTGWTTSQAGADQQFAIQDAGSWQSLITTSAGAADTFAHADDAAVAASNDAAAQITADDMNAQAAADKVQAVADSLAEGDFSDAEASQTSTEWQAIVQDLAGSSGTPWAQAEADKAAAEATWQTTATADEEQFVSTVAGDEVTYASDNATKFLTEARALDSADQTAANAAADASSGLATTLSGDEVGFETTAAGATDGFQIALANAQSSYDIAMATASLNLANGGSTADYSTAVATAAAGLTTAQASAASVYRGLVGPADALQTTDDANAVFLAVKTTADALLTDATTADGAIDVYSKAESDDYDQQQKDDAQALETLQVSDADGEAAAIHSEAGGYPSPWLNEMAAQALAMAAEIDTLAPAQQTQTDALADAQDVFEKSSADAQQTDADALATAWHDQAVADAQADQAQSIASANATTSLSTGGAYVAALPDAIFAALGGGGDPATLSADFSFADNVNDVSLDGAGWSYSVGSTSEDFTILPGTAAAMSPDLVDNPPYEPPNPYANLFQFHMPGDPPSTGGSGGGGTQPPATGPSGPSAPAVPPTNPEGAKETGDELERDKARKMSESPTTDNTTWNGLPPGVPGPPRPDYKPSSDASGDGTASDDVSASEPTVVIIVMAQQSPLIPLRPEKPWEYRPTRPADVAALLNDPSADASHMTKRDAELRAAYQDAKANADTARMHSVGQALFVEHGLPEFLGSEAALGQTHRDEFQGALLGVGKAAAVTAVVVVLAPANPALAAKVGGGILAWQVGSSVGSRLRDGQGAGALAGAAADVSGVNGMYVYVAKHDIISGKPVADPFARGEMGGAGGAQAGSLIVGGALAGKQLLSGRPAPTATFEEVAQTNSELVQEIATRAEAWGARKGLGDGSVAGTLKHGYAENLLIRYQEMFGSRGLRAEVRYLNGKVWESGMPRRDSIRLDVIEGAADAPMMVWDYKFGSAQMTPARLAQIRAGANLEPGVLIIVVRP